MSTPFNPLIPSTARMYDYYLGGKDHYPADRQAAWEVLKAAPSIKAAAVNNRGFMRRAVDYCANVGIRQFVDIGTGIPTYPNVADVARNVYPDAVVVGVDNDPQVLAHNNALLTGVHIVEGDIRHPLGVIEDTRLNLHIDWRQPVAVLFVAILHFIIDDQNPYAIVARFREHMAPGSIVVISHVCSTDADPEAVANVERIYKRATSPGVFRTKDEILMLFDGFEIVRPGLVPVQDWPWNCAPATDIPVLGGVGRKPEYRM